jgi:single-stranded DNA-specific DHH superfamily exonuclease
LDLCKDSLIKYGGHEQAAGLTVKPECVDKFNETFNNACWEYYKTNARKERKRYYDAELKPSSIDLETAQKLIDNLAPYCKTSNPEPIFKISDVVISETELREGSGWNLLTFYAVKDNKTIPIKMKQFTDELGTEINGLLCDIYFSFPQIITNYNDLSVVDIVFKK